MRIIAPLGIVLAVAAFAVPAANATGSQDTNGIIESGDTIHITNSRSVGSITLPYDIDSRCSLGPVISDTVAYTASHCGSVGTQVSQDGKVIGVITGTAPGRDISRIELTPGQQVRPDTLGEVPAIGETVHYHGSTSGDISGVVDSDVQWTQVSGQGVLEDFGIPNPFHFGTPDFSGDNFGVRMDSISGDSGAAVYNESGQVVGVLSGGESLPDGTHITVVAPVGDL